MSQASASYTPPEILQAGYKAEREGRTDYAVQFYRHLTDYYPQTAEAAEARGALQRIEVGEGAPSGQQPGRPLSLALDTRRVAEAQQQRTAIVSNAASHEQQVSRGRRAQRIAIDLPRPARGYWIGRCLAALMMLASAVFIVAGGACLAFGFVFGFDRPAPGGITTIVAGPALLGGGLVLLLFSQLCLAIYRIALATSDLAALTRAKAEAEHLEE